MELCACDFGSTVATSADDAGVFYVLRYHDYVFDLLMVFTIHLMSLFYQIVLSLLKDS